MIHASRCWCPRPYRSPCRPTTIRSSCSPPQSGRRRRPGCQRPPRWRRYDRGPTESVPTVAIDKDTISSKPSGHVTGTKLQPTLKDVCSQKLVEPSSQKRASRSNGQRRAIFQCQKQTSLQSKRVHDETQVKSRRSGSEEHWQAQPADQTVELHIRS